MPRLTPPKFIDDPPHKAAGHTRTKKKKTNETGQPAQVVSTTSFPISRLPTELQHMIWGYVFKRPACHTFKLEKARGNADLQDEDDSGPWDVVLKAHRKNLDNSTWRLWKDLHSLKNISFEKAFRYFTSDVRPIKLQVGAQTPRPAAAIDAAADLMILEFHRGLGQIDFGWYEHSLVQPGQFGRKMALDSIRTTFRHVKKVAIQYKAAHPKCIKPGPFRCTCPTQLAQTLNCKQYKCCPFEVACFLDCFPDLEEFHLVFEQRLVRERIFAAEYRQIALKNNLRFNCNVKRNGEEIVKSYDLARFFDLKFEYLEHLPLHFHKREMGPRPYSSYEGCRLADKIKGIYTSKTLDEPFLNDLEQRQKVKFGILIPYLIET